MTDLCVCAENFLLAVYSESSGLFPFSTRLECGRFVNDFEHPHTVRYTINSLLGLSRASQTNAGELTVRQVDRMTEHFLERHHDAISSPADFGLLALLLAERGTSPYLPPTLDRLGELGNDRRALRKLNIQDLGWMLWGASVAAQRKLPGARSLADNVFQVIREDFVEDSSGLATHSRSLYRRGIVSFGSTVYFLRSSYEYARLTGNPDASRLFANGVRRMIGVQGPLGEWPWILRVKTAAPVEFYPVFSVHQDSMAMLFLLPALDEGMPGVRDAVERSFAWSVGRNELGVPMLWSDPYFAYRSVERTERLPRARRYLRAAQNIAAHRQSETASGAGVRLNPECRSYHLGWILYAWAGRSDVPGREGQRLQALSPAG